MELDARPYAFLETVQAFVIPFLFALFSMLKVYYLNTYLTLLQRLLKPIIMVDMKI